MYSHLESPPSGQPGYGSNLDLATAHGHQHDSRHDADMNQIHVGTLSSPFHPNQSWSTNYIDNDVYLQSESSSSTSQRVGKGRATRGSTRSDAIMTRHRAAALARGHNDSNINEMDRDSDEVYMAQPSHVHPAFRPPDMHAFLHANRSSTFDTSPATSSGSPPAYYSENGSLLGSPFQPQNQSDTQPHPPRPPLPFPLRSSALYQQNDHFPSTPTMTTSSHSSYPSGRSSSPAYSIASTALTSLSGGMPSGSTSVYSPVTFSRPCSPDSTKRLPMKSKSKLTDFQRKSICLYAQAHPKMKQEDIANEFGVERSTISKILKSKEKWMTLDSSESRTALSAKHRPSKFPEVEATLALWIQSCARDKISLSDVVIRDKARETARDLGIPEDKFKASSGWVENFKVRHGIRRGALWFGPGAPGGKARRGNSANPATSSQLRQGSTSANMEEVEMQNEQIGIPQDHEEPSQEASFSTEQFDPSSVSTSSADSYHQSLADSSIPAPFSGLQSSQITYDMSTQEQQLQQSLQAQAEEEFLSRNELARSVSISSFTTIGPSSGAFLHHTQLRRQATFDSGPITPPQDDTLSADSASASQSSMSISLSLPLLLDDSDPAIQQDIANQSLQSAYTPSAESAYEALHKVLQFASDPSAASADELAALGSLKGRWGRVLRARKDRTM